MSANQNKKIYISALCIFVLGLGYLIYSGASDNSAYFLNVSEALAMQPGKLGQARLFGKAAEQGMTLREDSLGARFKLEDKDDAAKTVWVSYQGVVPDTFKPGVEVIVEGAVDPVSGDFQAASLITKCPSKYQKANRG